jgi:hypothetical protein
MVLAQLNLSANMTFPQPIAKERSKKEEKGA